MTINFALDKVKLAKREAVALLHSHPDVNGLGIRPEDTGYVLQVNLRRPLNQALPKEIAGIPVRFQLTGPITRR